MSVEIVTVVQRPDLLKTVASWIYEQWWSHDPNHNPETIAALLMQRSSTDHIFASFVALYDSKPVGTATLLDHDVGTERRPDLTPWVAAVYVIPSMRRKGIGRTLVSHATKYAESHGINTVYLWTTDRTSWYEHLGW